MSIWHGSNPEICLLLKLANYKGFVAVVDGHAVQIEKQCWHIFKPEYFRQDTANPNKKMDMDHEDNSVTVCPMDTGKVPAVLEGDEIVPVFSWDTDGDEALEVCERICQWGGDEGKMYKIDVSRAIRDLNTGELTNPSRKNLWNMTHSCFTRHDITGEDGIGHYSFRIDVPGSPQQPQLGGILSLVKAESQFYQHPVAELLLP